MLPYLERELAEGTPLAHVTRHVLGLYRGQPGGRAFRRVLSQRAHVAGAGIEVIEAALAEIESLPLEAVA
jgi:tRNA-dihydrouridine synthase A